MSENGPWTDFTQMNCEVSHLTQQQYMEAVNVMGQRPPYERTPRTSSEEAFFNEQIYQEERMKLQKIEDEKRWKRLLELGVISTEGDPICDWELEG